MSPTSLFPLTLLALAIFSTPTSFVNAAFPTREEAVYESIQYLSDLCVQQQRLLPPLLSALRSHDLSASKTAYANSRPPYEQIEVLANVFPDLDRDIDARPNVFFTGETDSLFKGFHVIERNLYRDNDPEAAIRPTQQLIRSVDALCEVLENHSSFSPESIFEGALTLAIEVPAKKISSEEETWSDLSILIFRSNFRGIWGVLSPFLALEDVPSEISYYMKKRYAQLIALINKIDPENGFDGVNGGAGTRPYSHVSTAEREAISNHAYYFVHAIKDLKKYVITIEEDHQDEEEAPGPVIDSTAYVKETAQGVKYLLEQCRYQRELLYDLIHAIEDEDVAKARNAYRIARPPYEQIEVLAPDFVDLDRGIDARPDAFELGELDPEWGGFHALERYIYRDEDLRDALPVAEKLNATVSKLCRTLRNSNVFTADSTWKGMLALAYEVPAKKISSEEETWSDLSVMIFRQNEYGIYSQYKPFKKRLPEYILADVEARFDDINIMFEQIIDQGNLYYDKQNRPYSEVPVYERRLISEKFYALAASLEVARAALIQA